mmetsp:Transcript_20675/g.45309  ORF Transcript_20675/g.45309 Transcript_20675/m.45309 type:complete len:265 (+) Transcript_20675:1089-1883(+)
MMRWLVAASMSVESSTCRREASRMDATSDVALLLLACMTTACTSAAVVGGADICHTMALPLPSPASTNALAANTDKEKFPAIKPSGTACLICHQVGQVTETKSSRARPPRDTESTVGPIGKSRPNCKRFGSPTLSPFPHGNALGGGSEDSRSVAATVLVPSGVEDTNHKRRPGREAKSQVAAGDWVEPEGTAAPPWVWKQAPNMPLRGLLPTWWIVRVLRQSRKEKICVDTRTIAPPILLVAVLICTTGPPIFTAHALPSCVSV